jgi:hypothetical protein
MKKLLLSAALVSASLAGATTVSYDWGKLLDNGTLKSNVYDAVLTTDGNWYTLFGCDAPSSSSPLKWGGNELTSLPADKSGADSKLIINKMTPAGDFLWTITSTYGAFTVGENTHMALMPDGGAVIAVALRRNTKETTEIDPLATIVDAKGNTTNITIANYPSDTFAYVPVIIKFSADGTIEWWRNLQKTYDANNIAIKSIVTDENGNIYIGGSFKSALSFPTSATEWGGTIAATANATSAMYIAKLDKDCNIVKTFTVDASAAYATSDQVQRLAYADGTLYWVGQVTGLTTGDKYTIGNTTVTPGLSTASKALPTDIIGSLTTDLAINWTTVLESQQNTAATPNTVIQNKGLTIGENTVYVTGALNGGLKSGDVQLTTSTNALYGFTLGFNKETGAIKGGNLYGATITGIYDVIENANNGHIITYGYAITSNPNKIFFNELDASYNNVENGETILLSIGTPFGHALNPDTNQYLSLSYGKGGTVLTDVADLGTQSAYTATVTSFTLSDFKSPLAGISTVQAADNSNDVNIYGIAGAAVFTANAAQNVAIYSATGALIKVAAIAEGNTTIELPAGFYIAAGKKFIVR